MRNRVCKHAKDDSVSAIIVNFNGVADLPRCIAALQADTSLGEIIVVDNASTDDSIERIAIEFPSVRVLISESNLGFAGGANLGARHATFNVLLFMNPDTFVSPGCPYRLRNALVAGAGVAGPVLRIGSVSGVERGSVIDLMGMPRGVIDDSLPLYVSGCCLATTRNCFDAVGGFDDRYFLFMEDVEYCWQALRRGYDVKVVSEAEAYHRGGASIGGGYVRNGAFEVSAMRIVLRERNTTAMLLACVPLVWLPWAVVASALRSLAFAGLLAMQGRWRFGVQVALGWATNCRWLLGTIRRRRQPGVVGAASRAAWGRADRRLYLGEYLLKRSPIRFVDADPPRAH